MLYKFDLVHAVRMAGIDEVQLRAEDDYAFEGDIADDSKFCSLQL